jgi:hypothetical protein
MKLSLATIAFSSIAILSSVAAPKVDCKSPADATFKSVQAKPDAVLEIVSKDVAASPKCACPIIKAAIAATDEGKTGEIAAAAMAAAPEEAASIKACLPKAALPNAGSPETAADGWFDPLIYGAGGMGIGVGGAAYSAAPASGAGAGVSPNNVDLITVIEVPVPGKTIFVSPPNRGTRS